MMYFHRSTTRHAWVRPALATMGVAALLASALSGCGSSASKAAPPKASSGGTTTQPTSASVSTTTPSVAPAGSAQPVIDVRMTDHAFEVSGPLRPGGTIRLSNAGVEAHYMQVRKLAAGHPFSEAKAAVDSQETMDRIAPEIGAPTGIVWPGHTVEITNPGLGAGEYVLLDWFPVEGDTNGTFHTAKGLVGHFSVRGEPATAPVATESYALSGNAIVGPSALRAGRHVLEIRFGAGVNVTSVFPTLFRLESGRTVETVVKELAAVFGADSWPVGSGKKLAASIVASLYGPTGGTSFEMGVDLEAGTYALVGLAYDNDGAPVLGAARITLSVAG